MNKKYIYITLILFIVIFSLQNSGMVSINILFWEIQMSRVILIVVLLLIGGILGYMLKRNNKKEY